MWMCGAAAVTSSAGQLASSPGRDGQELGGGRWAAAGGSGQICSRGPAGTESGIPASSASFKCGARGSCAPRRRPASRHERSPPAEPSLVRLSIPTASLDAFSAAQALPAAHERALPLLPVGQAQLAAHCCHRAFIDGRSAGASRSACPIQAGLLMKSCCRHPRSERRQPHSRMRDMAAAGIQSKLSSSPLCSVWRPVLPSRTPVRLCTLQPAGRLRLPTA